MGGRDLVRGGVSQLGPGPEAWAGLSKLALTPRGGANRAANSLSELGLIFPLPDQFLPQIPGSPKGTSPHHSDPLVLLHLVSQSHISGTHPPPRRGACADPPTLWPHPRHWKIIAGRSKGNRCEFRLCIFASCAVCTSLQLTPTVPFSESQKWGFMAFLGALGS